MKLEKIELKIYESLNEELNTNLRILDSSIFDYTNSILILQNTLSYVGTASSNLSEKAKNDIAALNYKKTSLRHESLESINNSIKFEFIESDVLKELIAAYPNEIDNFENQELKIEGIVFNRVKLVIEKHISLIDKLPGTNATYNNIRIYGNQSNYSELLDSKEYQNSIIDRLLQTKTQLNIAKGLRHKTETIAVKLSQILK